MVLSNKKLKQRLRAVKAESLAAEASRFGSNGVPEENRVSAELQELLEAKKKRPPKLIKGKKTGKTQSGLADTGLEKRFPSGEESGVGSVIDDVGEQPGPRQKRKRKAEIERDNEGDVNGKVARKMNRMKKRKKIKKIKKDSINTDEELTVKKDISAISQMDETVSSKVYVGGIPYYSTEDDIRSYFEGCGTIIEIDCMTFPDSGKFRGIAIISFKTEAAAKRALVFDGSDMGGFFLKIQPYKTTKSSKVSSFTPQMVEGYKRIYVGNLSWEITEDNLKDCFSCCNISSIRFGMDKETGEFRGYAHVDFSDSESVTKALKLDQQIVCGRPMKISCAIPKNGEKSAPVTVPACHDPKDTQPTAVSDKIIEPTVVSGKIRRRTCYDCGEKGHLSSDCPKKNKV